MREFETGATRDSDDSKLDYEGFINPYVLSRFAEYMHEHRKQADGKLRASDNWQKGIPSDAYMKSFIRHSMELWKLYRDCYYGDWQYAEMEDIACALLFNVQGFLLNLLRARDYAPHYGQESEDEIIRRDSDSTPSGPVEEINHESNGYSWGNIESVPVWIYGVPLRDKRVSPEEQEVDGLPNCEMCGCGVPPTEGISEATRHNRW